MKIGVICEGPTDYPAIEKFIGNLLLNQGIIAVFKPLFPETDRTRPDGGWANVLNWLDRYPAPTRVQRYLNGGLFGGGLTEENLDLIIVHLDSDILESESFCNHVKKKFQITVQTPNKPNLRAAQIEKILCAALQFGDLSDSDAEKHAIIPAVESTEAWCVGVFHARPLNTELLRGSELTNAFMSALEISESKKPYNNYTAIDKSLHRREKFVRKHASNSHRILHNCPEFAKIVRAKILRNDRE